MATQDWIVGGATIALGVTFFLAAASDWAWFFRLPKIKWVETRWGHPAARGVCFAIGLALTALGVVIACGITVANLFGEAL